MNADQLANLRALAEAATPGPWSVEDDGNIFAVVSPAGNVCTADKVDEKSDPDCCYIAAVSTDVVLELLDERDRLAARVLELEAPGECQSLHKLRAEVQVQSDRAEQAEILAQKLTAERDELAAEAAAYQGRPEGALPGWTPARGGMSALYERVKPGSGWFALVTPARRQYTWYISGDDGHTEGGHADSPLAAMRAAEADARSRGWM